MVSGEIPIAFALTEPHCGSDLASLRTTAVRNDDGWLINGRKTYVSTGSKAVSYNNLTLPTNREVENKETAEAPNKKKSERNV